VKTTSDTHRDPQRGRHQDRVDVRCVYGTFLLTFSARLDPFRSLEKASELLFAISQRFLLPNEDPSHRTIIDTISHVTSH
jgi:hypothetical protein